MRDDYRFDLPLKNPTVRYLNRGMKGGFSFRFLPLMLALGACSREPEPPQFDSMSEQDVTRIVENAIVDTMGDPGQTHRQRRIDLEESRYSQADLQIKTMHKLFKDWDDFEKKHPRHWYDWLGFDANRRIGSYVTIGVLRLSADGALESACPINSANATRQGRYLADDSSVQQIGSAYAMIDRDVAECMKNRRESIKSLKEMAATNP
ncbi:hypothetical protein [Novosphingobium sp.]|uniref:hypothetical protein n=1 Tax=Novosphingobium sp. TaxID=1874826 RepID=UPI0025D41180|nr:hypothetical protein [Novosphingobium sp.]